MKKMIIVFMLAVFVSLNIAAQEARIVAITGTVEVRDANSDKWEVVSVGSIIGKKAMVSTGIKSTAVIALGETSKLTVRPLTVLTLEELLRDGNTEAAVLNLRTGRVRADVTPPSGLKADFTVRSPTTTASVQGTSFEFDGRRLSVQSGKVRFSNENGQKVYVAAGQRSYSDSGSQHRLTTPFETETTQMSPALPELANTGSGGEPPQLGPSETAVSFNLNFNW